MKRFAVAFVITKNYLFQHEVASYLVVLDALSREEAINSAMCDATRNNPRGHVSPNCSCVEIK